MSQLTADEDDIRAPLAHLPSGLFGIGGGLVMAVAIFGFSLFAGTSYRYAVFIGVVFGMLLAVGFTVFAAWSKRWRGIHRVTLGQRVNSPPLINGRVPEGADPSEWLPWLAKSRRSWRVLTIVGLILYPGFVIIGIVVLAGGDGDSRVGIGVAIISTRIVLPAWQGVLQLSAVPRKSAGSSLR